MVLYKGYENPFGIKRKRDIKLWIPGKTSTLLKGITTIASHLHISDEFELKALILQYKKNMPWKQLKLPIKF